MSPLIKWLLIATGIVFLFQLLYFGGAGQYGLLRVLNFEQGEFELLWFGELFALVPAMVLEGYVWQLVTYMFVHGGFWHFFFNMFVLWMFGVSLERVWGADGFLQFYLICGIVAGLSMVIFAWGTRIPVVGASGAIYGILGAYAINWPDRLLYIWGIFPIKVKYLVFFLGLFDLTLNFFAETPIAHEAHLAGLAAGLLYAWKGNPSRSILTWLDEKRRQREVESKRREWEQRQERMDQMTREADQILDRLNDLSWEELTEEEKQKIEDISQELTDLDGEGPSDR